jgi:HEAT repeat protein
MEHEEIIRYLQLHPTPDAIPFLEKAIALKHNLQYLAYDDYGSYYKKCLWALVSIGTPEAIAVIERCARSAEKPLREQAIYRLGKIGRQVL